MTPEQLRASILQYAIQGKLVEQRSEEGTAEELYQKIQQERKQYKIKELSVDAINETPFDVPETWKWIHLQDIVKKTIKRGKSPKYAEKSNVQVFAQKCNVKTGGINMGLALFLDEAVIEKYPNDEYMCDGDIVINSTGGGTMGRVGIFRDTDRIDGMSIVPDGHVTVIRACDIVDYKYLFYFIKQNQKFLETQGDGSTNQTELKPVTIASLLLPLPPLEEQHRIVAKIEEILLYVDRYAESYEKLEQFNAKFPEDMKKSILQYAIMGKLVEQRPEEGTAEELYQQIQDELKQLEKSKLFKVKDDSPIEEEEIPFDIPSSWKWLRLGQILNIESGKGLTAKQMKKGDIPVYGGNGVTGYHDETLIHKKTVVIGRVGFYCGSVHVTPSEAWVTDNAFITTYSEKSIDRDYLVYVLRFLNLGQNSNATAQPVVSGKKIYPMLFPLPPLKEQKRIVARIEEILPICERLVK